MGVKRTVHDVTQFCVCCGRGDRIFAAKFVDRGLGLRPREEGAGNGIQAFTASMLTVLRLSRSALYVCASAVVTEFTSGVAFPSLHPVAFCRDRERRRSHCCTHGNNNAI